MNSGELPLKTRRKVSLAPGGAGTENAAEAAIEATAISRENRNREVFMVLSERKAIKVVCDRKTVKVMRDRKAVKVMCDRRAVNASIRCAAVDARCAAKTSLI